MIQSWTLHFDIDYTIRDQKDIRKSLNKVADWQFPYHST